MNRAYAQLTIKSASDDSREIVGIATTPSTDRMGDIVDSKGASFTLPIPLLWQHQHDKPIGEVYAASVTDKGIEVKARLAKISEEGVLKSRLDEAWQSLKAGLVRGLSIGFSALEIEPIKGSFGVRFTKWDWHELSAVTIPANADASITSIKALDAPYLALSGTRSAVHSLTPPAVAGPAVVVARKGASRMAKTYTESIKDFENTRAANASRMDEIQQKAMATGQPKDDAEQEEFDTLKAANARIDRELVDLREMEKSVIATARPVQADTSTAAAVSRSANPFMQVRQELPPGIGWTRFVIARAIAPRMGTTVSEYAKSRWADDSRLHSFIQKATVPAGLTSDATWAGNLVDPTNLSGEFLEYLRPRTLVGRIPGLRRVPFNVRVTGQSTGAVANWVGQAKPKPVTSFGTSATTLTFAKIAAISVISEELARFSSPSAEQLVRDELVRAVIERLDIDFIDPAQAAVANVNPASITNGLTALTSAGTSEANVRTDVTSILSTFIENNMGSRGLVLVMPDTLSLALSLMVNSLGQPAFNGMTPEGGTLLGYPVISTQYAANASGSGNLVIALKASDIFYSSDDSVAVDASREASIQMSDAPTNDASTGTGQSLVSMFQNNAIAIRAELAVNWAKARSTAVVYMDDVNWGSVGSPS